MADLLTRDDFRSAVYARDHGTCVVPGCGQRAHDAHHIIERRLWTAKGEEEGYFLENGASLCEWHHRYGAETCAIEPSVLRGWIRASELILPSGWNREKSYDKWGTELKRPNRLRVKYPSTPYLPMSPGAEPNDINLPDLKPFLNQPLVFTIKMDGSNAMLTYDRVAARNGDHADHSSFDWLKAWHGANRQKLFPSTELQVFGEYLYARHSIHYRGALALPSLFQVFGVYSQTSEHFGSWSQVEKMAGILGFPTVPVLEKGSIYRTEGELVKRIHQLSKQVIVEGQEGLVVRVVYPFPYGSFEGYETGNTNDGSRWRVNPIAKFVRPNHVQTDEHWDNNPTIRNETRSA